MMNGITRYSEESVPAALRLAGLPNIMNKQNPAAIRDAGFCVPAGWRLPALSGLLFIQQLLHVLAGLRPFIPLSPVIQPALSFIL